MADEVVGCIVQVFDHLQTVEECMALDMELLLSKSGIAEVILAAPVPVAYWDAEAAAPLFADVETNLQGVSLQSKPMSRFLNRLAQLLRSLPADMCSKERAEATIKDFAEPLRGSEASRSQLVEVYRLMSEVLSNPDTTAASFYEEI